MELIQHAPNIWTIPDFWDRMTCFALIQRSEELGYQEAGIATDKGQRIVKSVRNNDRVLFEDFALAEEIWDRAKLFVPQTIGRSEAIGLNELFRFYRYSPGQQFKRHRDESFIRNEQEASYFTFMIYLNDGFGGGNTTFNELAIRPAAGTALVFLHDLEHSGDALSSGKKYVLRTDVMYRLSST